MASDANEADHFDAEVWLKLTDGKLEHFVDDTDERHAILRVVWREARRHKMDADLVLAVMHVESHFDRFAVSPVGAQGLMQVMPFWRMKIGRPEDNLMVLDTNVRYGTAILAHYVTVANGDLIDALARYNGSRGRLNYPELVVAKWRRTWQTQTTVDLPQLREGCLNYRLKACW